MGADPILDVEMSSTGEVACFGENFAEAYLKSLKSSNVEIPEPYKNYNICVSLSKNTEIEGINSIEKLLNLGYNIYSVDKKTNNILKTPEI